MRFLYVIMILFPAICLSQTKMDTIEVRIKNLPETYHDTIYYELGKMQIDSNNYEKSIPYFKKSIDLAKKYNHSNQIVYSNFFLGVAYFYLVQFGQSIECFLEVIKYSNQTKLIRYTVSAYNEIGLIYLELNNYQEALNNIQSALNLKRKYNITDAIIINEFNIALCYNHLNQYDISIEMFLKIIKECMDCDDVVLMNSYLGLIDSYLATRNFNNARYYINKLFNFKIYDRSLLSRIYYYLSQFAEETGVKDSVKFYLNKGLQYALESNDHIEIIRDKTLLAKLYEQDGNYEKALKLTNEVNQLKDTINKPNLIEKFRDSYVDLANFESGQIIHAKEASIQRNQQLIVLLGIIVVLLIATFFFAYKNASIRKRLNEKLSDKVFERTHELNSFLYRTSHDLAGPLATMKGLIHLVDKNKHSEDISSYLDKMKLTSAKQERIINRLEAVSRINATPLKPERINLRTFLKDTVDKVKDGFLIAPEIIIKGNPDAVIDRELTAGIIENLLNNCYNHVDNREPNQKIRIEIINDNNLVVSVIDTGTGIIEGQENKIFDLFFSGIDKHHRTGIGLYFAKVAVERLGGQIILKNNRKPTIFEIRLPSIRSRRII